MGAMFEGVNVYVILILSTYGGIDYVRNPDAYSTIVTYRQEDYGACQAHAEWLTGKLPGPTGRAICVPYKFIATGKQT
jgi:hypothetical protein